MTDKREGPLIRPLKWFLYALSLLYGAAIVSRKLMYRFGILKARKVPMKVISVGNLTLGGTGKTPFTITLAKIMKEELGKEVCVLTRGYGWDEQAMLKENLASIPVLVGEDRHKSARRAIKLYGSDTAILDDGFQHWELKHDMDIVLIDSGNPFGNSFLFPRGILREGKEALKRADAAVFTKVNKLSAMADSIKKEVGAVKSGIIFLEAVHRPKHFIDAKAKNVFKLDCVRSKRVIMLSSIGDPDYFEENIKSLGADLVKHIRFADHHNYTQNDIKSVLKICDERAFDFIVTTEKDAVKLRRLRMGFGNYRLLVLVIDMEIVNGKENLIAGLNSLYTRQDTE